MLIRKAIEKDLDKIVSLFAQTIEFVNSKDYLPPQINAWKKGALKTEQWLKKISEQYFLIAEISQEIVGFGSITHDGYLDFLYISKDHQRKGIASTLYNELESFAKTARCNKISSDVSITAKPFFQQQGFEVIMEQQVNIDGVKLINYKMEKILTFD